MLVIIINDYKTMGGNLEIPSLSRDIFNVFSHEKSGCNSVKKEISKKRNINRKSFT